MAVKNFEAMLELQDEANYTVNPNWRDEGFAWHRAVWTECAELMDLLSWKWWKRERQIDDDLLQKMRGEAVDILHFVFSGLMVSPAYNRQALRLLAEKFDKGWDVMVPPSERSMHKLYETDLIRISVEQVAQISLTFQVGGAIVSTGLISSLGYLFHQLAMNEADVFRAYCAKNVLNNFRQIHGYQDGHYEREWGGMDDNDRLTEIVKEIPEHLEGADFISTLMHSLAHSYESHAGFDD